MIVWSRGTESKVTRLHEGEDLEDEARRLWGRLRRLAAAPSGARTSGRSLLPLDRDGKVGEGPPYDFPRRALGTQRNNSSRWNTSFKTPVMCTSWGPYLIFSCNNARIKKELSLLYR